MARGSIVDSSAPLSDEVLYDPEVGEDIPGELERQDVNELEEEVIQQPNARADIERRARDMGWHPRHEYRGPPGKWVDADKFIENGETVLPIVRARNARLEEDLRGLNGTVTKLQAETVEQRTIIQDLHRMAQGQEQRGYERAKAELLATQRAAVETGDTATYDRASQSLENLEQNKPKAPIEAATRPAATTQAPPNVAPEVVAFVGSNAWFNTDKVLNAAMQAEHLRLQEEDPGMPLGENLTEAKARVMEQYPERFGMTRTQQPRQAAPRRAAVSAPTGGNQQPRREKSGFDRIDDAGERQQARMAYERMKRQIPDMTETDYMNIYDNPHGDVLELQRAKKKEARANGR